MQNMKAGVPQVQKVMESNCSNADDVHDERHDSDSDNVKDRVDLHLERNAVFCCR